MPDSLIRKPFLYRCFCLVLVCCLAVKPLYSDNLDSLYHALSASKKDTNRANLLRNMAYEIYLNKPDTALNYVYEALNLSRSLKYKEGMSKSYEFMASILTRMGNYQKALEYYIQALKIEEESHSSYGMASIKLNMGVVYAYIEDYRNAFLLYRLSDSILKATPALHKDVLHFICLLNMGDLYEKKKDLDSAYYYYNQSLSWAQESRDNYRIGVSYLGLANVYAKKKQQDVALSYYRYSLIRMKEEGNDDLYCEAGLGAARIFLEMGKTDSSKHYAHLSLSKALQDDFSSRAYDAEHLLSELYEKQKRFDSAYFYLLRTHQLKDSLLGAEKSRLYQQITFNENLRQLELKEKELKEKEERRQQLQHIFISIFIPILFLVTLFFARVKFNHNLIRFFGVVSLLILFEYLTLLLHPYVQEFTHHQPILEIIVFVCIAAILIPAHHKIEHWLIEKLIHRKKELLIPPPKTKKKKRK